MCFVDCTIGRLGPRQIYNHVRRLFAICGRNRNGPAVIALEPHQQETAIQRQVVRRYDRNVVALAV